MRNQHVVAAIARRVLAAGALLLIGSALAAPAAAATPPASISGHFTLQATDGHKVTDATFRGKWLVVYFGYTSCPDVCPTVILRLGQALTSIGSAAEQIQPIFITVDPARDTPERLAKYMASFDPRVIGLRGDLAQTQDAARQFHVYYRTRKLDSGDYSVDHSSFLYILDPRGQFSKLLADTLSSDQLAAEFRTLAAESATGPFADADNPALVAAGKLIYRDSCAACHGKRLQGQPLWQLTDQFAGRRAPAHDQTGHTWSHSDAELVYMTLEGRFPASTAAAPSYMPAFRSVLTTPQVIATLAFIKATWPIGLRIYQASLNPGNRGMPALTSDVAWTLPPTCASSAQRWRETSR